VRWGGALGYVPANYPNTGFQDSYVYYSARDWPITFYSLFLS